MREMSDLLMRLNNNAILITLILAIASVVYAIFIILNFWLLKRDSYIRNRPYISISKVEAARLTNEYIFEMRNSGKTPAKIFLFRVEVSGYKEPECFFGWQKPQDRYQRAILLPDQNLYIPCSNIPKNKKIGLRITIKYSDIIYKKRYKTMILYKLEGNRAFPIDSSVT